MHLTLSKVFLSSLALGQCYAVVTWETIGCTGWTFDGNSIDQIWDNAIDLATNAQNQLDAIPSTSLSRKPDAKKIALANGRFMFGVDLNPLSGLPTSPAKRTIAAAKAMYTGVSQGLAKTLTGAAPNADGATFNLDHAYLFCGGLGLTQGPVPNSPFLNDVWHAQVTVDNKPTYIVPAYSTAFGAPRPCTEVGDQSFAAKTFETISIAHNDDGTAVSKTFVGIILCPSDGTKGILQNGFVADQPSAQKPTPNKYLSVSGTLVHEMVHVVGRSKNTDYNDGPIGGTPDQQNYGFDKCVNLADKNQAAALINPDNYRIFAEMSMSPATRWVAADPVTT